MGVVERARGTVERARRRALLWSDTHLEGSPVPAIALRFWRRDHEAYGTVLGSAIALRLFLFVVPANVALIGLMNLLNLEHVLGQALEAVLITGEMATTNRDVAIVRGLSLLVSGTVLTLWAGRSLVLVLATCSTAAWRLDPTALKPTLRRVAALSGMLVVLVTASALFSWMRRTGTAPVSLTAWIAVGATMAAGWLLVSSVLPQRATDLRSLLPGAVVMGTGFAVLQWVMQIYLPARIERSTDTYGSLATTVAGLGYFFLIGRLMSATFVLDAVVHEHRTEEGGLTSTTT